MKLKYIDPVKMKSESLYRALTDLELKRYKLTI